MPSYLYRKKPLTIEAIQLTNESFNECLTFLGSSVACADNFWNCPKIEIKTLEGNHMARSGDYIIRGIAGEFYSCKENIFLKLYDQVKDCESCINYKREENLDHNANCMLDCSLGKYFDVGYDRWEKA
jgi:hypothetical protein